MQQCFTSKMLEKVICLGIMLGVGFSLCRSTQAEEKTSVGVELVNDLVRVEGGKQFIARDPLNPSLPFPADPSYKEKEDPRFANVMIDGVTHWGQVEFDLDVRTTGDADNASEKEPKLYGWRQYLTDPSDASSDYNTTWQQPSGLHHAGIVTVPYDWGFHGSLTDKAQVIPATGNRAHYTEELSHVQVWDNRLDNSDGGWAVQAKLRQELTRGGQTFPGVYISLPKGDARNEFHISADGKKTPDLPDERLRTIEAVINAETPSLIAETKSAEELQKQGFTKEQIQTNGQGMSTIVWQTKDIALHIPAGLDLQQFQNYDIHIQWFLEKTPSI